MIKYLSIDLILRLECALALFYNNKNIRITILIPFVRLSGIDWIAVLPSKNLSPFATLNLVIKSLFFFSLLTKFIYCKFKIFNIDKIINPE